jgi:hypothetical protein
MVYVSTENCSFCDRAEEWGLENPLFTGCLQVFQADRKLRIALYTYKDQTRLVMDAENVVPFGQCPIGELFTAVD